MLALQMDQYVFLISENSILAVTLKLDPAISKHSHCSKQACQHGGHPHMADTGDILTTTNYLMAEAILSLWICVSCLRPQRTFPGLINILDEINFFLFSHVLKGA